jgi:prevent-host-death family protein
MANRAEHDKDVVADLHRLPASEVKQRGWKGVMRTLADKGAVVVTNHGEPEAVVVSAAEYGRLVAKARASDAAMEGELEALRRRFDERLAVLNQRDAGDRLRAAARRPVRLRGKVRAGSGY